MSIDTQKPQEPEISDPELYQEIIDVVSCKTGDLPKNTKILIRTLVNAAPERVRSLLEGQKLARKINPNREGHIYWIVADNKGALTDIREHGFEVGERISEWIRMMHNFRTGFYSEDAEIKSPKLYSFSEEDGERLLRVVTVDNPDVFSKESDERILWELMFHELHITEPEIEELKTFPKKLKEIDILREDNRVSRRKMKEIREQIREQIDGLLLEETENEEPDTFPQGLQKVEELGDKIQELRNEIAAREEQIYKLLSDNPDTDNSK